MAGNIRRYREFRGMSQSALARAMSEQGWPWHQQTVAKVEAGRQAAGVSEAAAVAEILGVSLDRLLWAGAEAAEVASADRASAVLRQSWEECATAVARLLLDRDAAQAVLASAEASKYPRVRAVAGELAADLRTATLKAAITAGEARHENPEG